MPIRIDDAGGAGQTSPIQRRLADLGKSRARVSSSNDLNAEVELSADARAILRAKQIARTQTDLRADRVAEIRAQVEAGTYRVSSQDIARRILEELGASFH
jgi:negative regulator of flagellin synthesis FlgM